jgi:hypothetical protein
MNVSRMSRGQQQQQQQHLLHDVLAVQQLHVWVLLAVLINL